MEIKEALDEATGMVRGSRWGTQEWRDDVADTIRAFHTRISEPGSNATDDRTEIGCNDAAMWKVQYELEAAARKKADAWHNAAARVNTQLEDELAMTKEFLAECTEQRDVAWKRIDQLLAERGESVSQEKESEPMDNAGYYVATEKTWSRPEVIAIATGDEGTVFEYLQDNPETRTMRKMRDDNGNVVEAKEYHNWRDSYTPRPDWASPPVSQEVDHLAEAASWEAEFREDTGNESAIQLANHHLFASIAQSLATLAGCVSTYGSTRPYFVQGKVGGE